LGWGKRGRTLAVLLVITALIAGVGALSYSYYKGSSSASVERPVVWFAAPAFATDNTSPGAKANFTASLNVSEPVTAQLFLFRETLDVGVGNSSRSVAVNIFPYIFAQCSGSCHPQNESADTSATVYFGMNQTNPPTFTLGGGVENMTFTVPIPPNTKPGSYTVFITVSAPPVAKYTGVDLVFYYTLNVA
jgi:hypothetical protein